MLERIGDQFVQDQRDRLRRHGLELDFWPTQRDAMGRVAAARHVRRQFFFDKLAQFRAEVEGKPVRLVALGPLRNSPDGHGLEQRMCVLAVLPRSGGKG